MDNTPRMAPGAEPMPAAADAARKRFQAAAGPNVPLIIVGADGSIQYLSPTARRMLDYRQDQAVESSFFSLIDGKHLYQVMRDVADMVCHGKSRANWLLRLRAHSGRWKWFKADVFNQAGRDEGLVNVVLAAI